jgi:hypothetical protein
MDEPVAVPFSLEEAGGRSIGALCAAYPGYCATYYARKWLAYFWPVFPKYSTRHRVFNALYFGGLLALSGVGLIGLLRRGRREGWGSLRADPAVRAAALCVTMVLTAGLFHTVTHIDPDARYVMVWVPVWISGAMLMAQGAVRPPQAARAAGGAG